MNQSSSTSTPPPASELTLFGNIIVDPNALSRGKLRDSGATPGNYFVRPPQVGDGEMRHRQKLATERRRLGGS